jgi:hypothetical protein
MKQAGDEKPGGNGTLWDARYHYDLDKKLQSGQP